MDPMALWPLWPFGPMALWPLWPFGPYGPLDPMALWTLALWTLVFGPWEGWGATRAGRRMMNTREDDEYYRN